MLKTRVIPVMLCNGFHLIKTIQFSQLRTLGNPIQTAKVYNSRNVDELIFIDMLASQENREPAYELIADVMQECFMPVAIGGGLKKIEHIDKLMKAGADKVVINSAAIANPKFITAAAKKYGSQCIVAGIDAKKERGEHFVYRLRGTDNAMMEVAAWAKRLELLGAGEIFLNSIDRDGIMRGYDLELIKKVIAAVSVPVIACGGAGTPEDCVAAVKVGHADAVSLSSVFHYTQYTPNNIKQAFIKADIPARLIK